VVAVMGLRIGRSLSKKTSPLQPRARPISKPTTPVRPIANILPRDVRRIERGSGALLSCAPKPLRAAGLTSAMAALPGTRRVVDVRSSVTNGMTAGKILPKTLLTHQFKLSEMMAAYDTFADAAKEHALKVIIRAE
jgi:hypothetical protein